MKAKAAAAKHKEMKAKVAAVKHKEMKAKAAAANIIHLNKILSPISGLFLGRPRAAFAQRKNQQATFQQFQHVASIVA